MIVAICILFTWMILAEVRLQIAGKVLERLTKPERTSSGYENIEAAMKAEQDEA